MKNKKCNWLTCAGLILLSVSCVAVSATTFTWTGAVSDDWVNPGNWNPTGTPTKAALDTGRISTLPGAVFYGGTGSCHSTQIGYQTEGALTLMAGTFDATGLDVGHTGGTGTLNIYDGNHNCRDVCPGYTGPGTVNMYGGFLRATREIRQGYNAGATGYLNMYGGTLSTTNMNMARLGSVTVSTLIADGVILLDTDKTVQIQGYINNGWIVVPNENYELILEYNGSRYPGKTALYALYNDLYMIPKNNATVRQNTNQLQWTLPEPNSPGGVVTCDVFFGTDPNILLDPKIVNRQSVESATVTLDYSTAYYWKVNVYDSSLSGTEPSYESRVFTFNTFNVAPTVDAGNDIQTWWPVGPRTVQLAGFAVDDDHAPDPVASTWTVLSQPDPLNPAVINSQTALNSTVTLNAIGTYVLQLEATDGEYTVTDTMQIIVYEDACEHASNQPGFVWLSADANQDCKVDIVDLAAIAAHWLQGNYSVE